MPLPHIALTDSQYRLLAELVINPLPSLGREPKSAAARGLDPQQLRTDVPALVWMQLISEASGTLSITMLGTAIFHRAKQETVENRLADVAAFADTLEAASGSKVDHRRIPYALRQLAQGAFSLDEAIDYLSRMGHSLY